MADIAVEPLLSRLAVLGRLVMDPSMAAWRKSTFCNGADTCVEVALLPDGSVAVRDSKDGDGLVIRVPAEVWQAFVEVIAYRQRGDVGAVTLTREVDRLRADVWVLAYEGVVLRFTDLEVASFVAGVKDGEFDLDALIAQRAGDGSGVNAPQRRP